jgi:acyl-homoserine-lactone acylase
MTDYAQFLREQASLKTLLAHDRLSFTELIDAALSTRSELADRILDDLIAAARRSGRDEALEAAEVLAHWDRRAEADSQGMALFAFWHHHWVHQTLTKLTAANPMAAPGAHEVGPALLGSALFYAAAWDPQDPLNTPNGLFSPLIAVQALETAANQLRSMGLPLNVAWGEVARFRRDVIDLPASGGSGDLGISLAYDFIPGEDGRLQAAAGASYMAAVEFAHPVRALVVMPYGNASQTGSPHVADQLPLAAKKELRPALRMRAEIEANLEARTVFDR